ncbi:MAG: hypothetical protein RMX96_34210 [Nostoc sp. ChiSLP02]|nr:hypothetical protein [Nostoc sp. DedSLP05]MDZ8097038.1 hypothetical protein [Nostoc sp. DedSLP01]MDZ8189877.1 hypothetical protein [Nostoc sp. ChiSLP02]
MMKSFFIPLAVLMSAIALPQSAYGNQEDVPIATGDRNQAEVLLTQPATINSTWSNFAGKPSLLRPAPQSISAVQDPECQKINPLEILNNPESFFRECQRPASAQSRQNSEPIEYLKVPKLDSGIKLTVTQF